jgi:RHS repeat-associated protein
LKTEQRETEKAQRETKSNCTFLTGYERDIESDLDFAQARMYNKNHGRFTSPDDFRNDSQPDDPQSWNLYLYVRNKPLIAIDPTGEMTDYLDKNTGDITRIEDGKDQVIATDTAKINQMVKLSTTAGGQYWRELNVLEAYGESNLGLTRGEFDKLAGAVYAESSGGVAESAGIVDVLQNRADADSSTLMAQVTDAPGYRVNGVRSNAYSTEQGPAADQKRSNVRIAIAKAIPGKDTTNGAYYWDGKDFNKNARGNNSGYQERIAKGGYLFTNPSHDLWNQGSLKVKGTYTYQSTAAIGSTTFSKLYAPKKSWRY